MIKNVSISDSMMKTIEAARKNLLSNQAMIDRFLDSSTLKTIETAKKNLISAHLKLEPYITKIIQDQIKIKKQIELIKKRDEKEKVVMLESGWWFTPSLMGLPAANINIAIDNYLNGEKRAISNLFVRTYQNNNCENLKLVIEFWDSNCKFIKEWIPVINQAFEAHKRREYLISIPALLLSCEGIATDYCKSFKIEAPRSNGNLKIQKSVKRMLLSEKNYIRAELLFKLLDSQIYADTEALKRASYKYFLNRHAVLHGISNSYGSRKNSLKCFMLIDVLSLLN